MRIIIWTPDRLIIDIIEVYFILYCFRGVWIVQYSFLNNIGKLYLRRFRHNGIIFSLSKPRLWTILIIVIMRNNSRCFVSQSFTLKIVGKMNNLGRRYLTSTGIDYMSRVGNYLLKVFLTFQHVSRDIRFILRSENCSRLNRWGVFHLKSNFRRRYC
jgi:hypothetical protein